MKQLIYFILFLAFPALLQGQELAYSTFKDTRVINTHTVEMLPKRKLDVRIGHRFGDLLGDAGGWPTFYGLETASDIMIGAEYGVSDDINVGIYRTKGAGDLKMNLNGLFKYRLAQQSEGGQPISLTLLGVYSLSTMQKNDSPGSVNSFPKFAHRMAYNGQMLVGRHFSDAFALQLGAGYTHRNLVPDGETNGIFSASLATRIQISKVFGIIADCTLPLSGAQSIFEDTRDYYPILGIGLEMETGGHVFQVNFTNAEGIMETDYIPNTTTNWLDGQFRLGFTISRKFNL